MYRMTKNGRSMFKQCVQVCYFLKSLEHAGNGTLDLMYRSWGCGEALTVTR